MTTKEVKVNKLRLTWWMYIALIPGLVFIPFAYAGFSSKDRKLVYFAYIYFLPIILVDYFPSLSALAWIGGISHIFLIKNKYVKRRLEMKSNKLNKFSSLETVEKVSTVEKEVVKIKIEEELKETETVSLDLGKEEDKLVDINCCSEEELEKLPFINSIIAKKAIQQREAIGSFSSVEEFGISIGLKPHIIEKIRPLVIIGEVSVKEDKKEKGRVIDL